MLREIAIGSAFLTSMAASVQGVEAFNSIGPDYLTNTGYYLIAQSGEISPTSLFFSFTAAASGRLQSFDYVLRDHGRSSTSFDIALYAGGVNEPTSQIAKWGTTVVGNGTFIPRLLTRANDLTIDLVAGTTYYFGFESVVGTNLQVPVTTLSNVSGLQATRWAGSPNWNVSATKPGEIEYMAFRVNVPSPAASLALCGLFGLRRRRPGT